MINKLRRDDNIHARAIIIMTAFLAVSCAPQYSSPQQLRASNPSITYKYHNDQELLQVNQTAAGFCNQYRALPQPVNFANDPDGSKVVIFDCVQTAPMVSQPQFNPNVAYDYRTDQELLDASRNAQIYCANNGSPMVISNFATNVNGTRKVAFQCSRS